MARRDPLEFTTGGDQDQFGFGSTADDDGGVPAPPPIRRDGDVPAVTGELAGPPKTPYVPQFDPAPGSKRRWLQRPSWASEPRPVTTKASGGTVVTFPPRSAPSWEDATTVGSRTLDRAVDPVRPPTGPGAHSLRPNTAEDDVEQPERPMLFLDDDEDWFAVETADIGTRLPPHLMAQRELDADQEVEPADEFGGHTEPEPEPEPEPDRDREPDPALDSEKEDEFDGDSELDALLAELSAVSERAEYEPAAAPDPEPEAEPPRPDERRDRPGSVPVTDLPGPTARSLDVDRPPRRRRPPVDSRAPTPRPGPRRPPPRPPRSRTPRPPEPRRTGPGGQAPRRPGSGGRSLGATRRRPATAGPSAGPRPHDPGRSNRRPVWVKIEEEDLGPFGHWSRPLGLGLAAVVVFVAVLILALQVLS